MAAERLFPSVGLRMYLYIYDFKYPKISTITGL
jgi:hypothetical protein